MVSLLRTLLAPMSRYEAERLAAMAFGHRPALAVKLGRRTLPWLPEVDGDRHRRLP